MNTTKILGEAVGIQSQGAVDHTESQTKLGLTSAIIIGQFKRGRVDRPMVIHNGNIRGQLGHEPNNPYYNAVQDCLDTGVPSIQVLRVGGIDNGNVPISCDGAISHLPLSGRGVELSLLFIVNDEIAGRIDGGLNILAINEILSPYGLCFIDNVGIINLSNQYVRVKVIAGSFDEVTNEILGYYNFWTLLSLDNPTVTVKQLVAPDYDIPEPVEPEIYNENTHTPMYAEVTACLAPSNSATTCDGATDNVGFTISFPLTDNFTSIYDDPLGYIGVNDFKVDGVNVPTNALPFNCEVVLLKYGTENVSELADGARVKLINDIGPNKRIEFSRPQGLYFDWDSNPTLQWDENTNLVTCCLAHSVPAPIQISCDGATDNIHFPGIAGYWDFYLDDFNNPILTGAANDLTYYFNTEMADKFAGDFDGFFWLENLDNVPHRFKFVPVHHDEYPNSYTPPTDNPTFMEHDDGSLTFCLVPVT